MLLEDITRFRLLDEVKSNLVATVSHELKTPLTSIRLVLHLLLEEERRTADAQATRAAGRRPRQCRAAAGDDQQPAGPGPAGAGRTQLHLRPRAAGVAVADGGRLFRPRAEDRGVELIVEDAGDLAAVAVDADQFQHALQNLLDNALVHTPQGGRITLAAQAGRRQWSSP